MSSGGHLQVIQRRICCLRSAERRRSTMRILVVEDEARIRAFLARAFEAEGFKVDVAEDGEGGLTLAPRRRLRAGDPRPPAAGPRRPRRAARTPSRAPGPAGADPLGAHRSGDQAARLRARRRRLPGEAVLARRAARAARGCSCAARTPPMAARSCARGRLALDVTRRQARVGDVVADLLGSRVPRAALPDAARRPGGQPRAPAVRGLGLRLRSALERRRRLRAPAAPPARPDAPIETVRNAGYRAAA